MNFKTRVRWVSINPWIDQTKLDADATANVDLYYETYADQIQAWCSVGKTNGIPLNRFNNPEAANLTLAQRRRCWPLEERLWATQADAQAYLDWIANFCTANTLPQADLSEIVEISQAEYDALESNNWHVGAYEPPPLSPPQ